MTSPVRDWVPPSHFPTFGPGDVVACDVETEDLKIEVMGPGWCFPNGGEIIGVSCAWAGGSGYWPVGHVGGGNFDREMVLRWLRKQAANPAVTWVFHNQLYDRGWLRRYGVEFAGACYDTQAAASMLNEYRHSYSLDSVGLEYLGVGKQQNYLRELAIAKGLIKKNAARDAEKAVLRLLAGHEVGPYAEFDAVLTRRLWTEKLYAELIVQELWPCYAQIEMPLVPVLLDMRQRGIRIDEEKADFVSKQLRALENGLRAQLRGLVGKDVAVWEAADIATVFDAKGLSYPLTPKTKVASFQKQWLEKHPDPIAQQILQIRQFERLRNVFVDGYLKQHLVNGRVHPEFHPLASDEGGTVSGRFSSSNPTFHNLPARDKEHGKLIRGLCLPEPGERWAANDYAQQEPRWTVHYAHLTGQRGAAEAVARYTADPGMDIYKFLVDLTQHSRHTNKEIFLGRCYGQGGGSICVKLGLPAVMREGRDKVMRLYAGPEGEEILKVFDQEVPFVAGLVDECQRAAKIRGQIRTVGGRLARFTTPKNPNSKGWAYPFKALNRLIQGSSADQLKVAMIESHRAGKTILVPVHDELGFSVVDEQDAREAAQIMETCMPCTVPFKVDVQLGDSWGDAL